MLLLPKLTFVFLNAILHISSTTLTKIQTLLNTFIWVGRGVGHLRLWLSLAEKNLRDGGVAIPNIRKYYEAAMLSSCVVVDVQ